MSLLQQKAKRLKYGAGVLKEIMKQQKAIGFAIPKEPFERLVRSICDGWHISFKWNTTSILCLQELAEDFLEKYFEDATLVAAHAHRVTLMVKDFNTLSRVRWRYDKLVHHVEWQDFKMRDILLIPPTRKSKVDEVKVVEVTHSKNTRGKATYEESLKQQIKESKSIIDLETV